MGRGLIGLWLFVAALAATAASAGAAPFVYVANEGPGFPIGPGRVSQYEIGAGGLLAPLSPPMVAAGSWWSARS